VRRFTIPTLLCCCGLAASASAAEVQVFAAAKPAKKIDPVVETTAAVPAFATPERGAAPQLARTRATIPTASRVSAAQPIARATTTTFEPVMPAGALTRSTASQTALVRNSTTQFAAVGPGAPNKKQFTYTDPAGQVSSAEVLRGYQPKQIASPIAKIDPTIDPKLRRAATIAQERARAYTRRRCWRYVKEALLASGVIDSYPKTVNAKDAGMELVQSYGFKKLPIKDPYAAPVGSVLVYYKGRNRPGHVELRTKDGFVSDFRSKTPDRHALLGVFAKRG
jgi:hypothetical protein